MHRIILSIFVFLISFCSSNAQGSYPQWEKDYAWGGDGNDRLMDLLETDKDQSVVAVGHTNSSKNNEVSEGPYGNFDWWVIKMDTSDNLLWDKRFGGDSNDYAMVVREFPDEGYLIAGSSASGNNGTKQEASKGGYDYWVMKLNKNGGVVWEKSFGGSGDDLLNGAILLNDGVLLVGQSNSNASGDKSESSRGGNDYWVVKIDNNGALKWEKTIGGVGEDIGMSAFNRLGIYYIGGYSDSDQGDEKSEMSYGGFDYWLLSMDDQGTILWDSTYGGTQNDYFDDFAESFAHSAIYVGGTTFSGSNGNKSSGHAGAGDIWMLEIDSAGNVLMDRNYGGGTANRFKDIVVSPEGAPIVGMVEESGISTSYRIMKIDTTGNIFWNYKYSGDLADSLEAVYLKCDRGLWVGGFSYSNVSGDRSRFNRGQEDYWIFELSIPTIPKFVVENVCHGVPLNFYDESDVWPDVWEWDFDDPTSANNKSTDQHPIHTYSEPGIYNVTLKIKEGCQNDTSITKSITVYENTVLGTVDLGKDFNMCEGETAVIDNEGGPVPLRATWKWSTGDSTETITVDTVGWYHLTISDAHCSERDSVELDWCPQLVYPNAFTPNGDAINEEFFAVGKGIREFHMMIFNRWGMLIFESFDLMDYWNGTYKSNLVQEDVYVVKVIYKGLGSREYVEYGTVTVIR